MLATSICASQAKEIDILYEKAVHEVSYNRTTYWTSFQLKADRRPYLYKHWTLCLPLSSSFIWSSLF